jgi:arsenate reductase-like glutaredoxin family protein
VRELAPDTEEHNFGKEPLTAAEIGELVDLAGGVAKILSTRNANAKERGWTADNAPDKATFVRAAAEDNNLLKRPILVRGERVVIGKDVKAIRELLS